MKRKIDLPKYLDLAISNQARLRKIPLDEYIEQALTFYLMMPKSLLYNAEKVADAYEVTTADVIAHAAIHTFAQNEAILEVYDERLSILRKLFIYEKDDDESKAPRLITDTALFENLKATFRNRLKRELEEGEQN